MSSYLFLFFSWVLVYYSLCHCITTPRMRMSILKTWECRGLLDTPQVCFFLSLTLSRTCWIFVSKRTNHYFMISPWRPFE
ncbi:hypothetical protein GE09DRAFT_336740 [Coniochaeta sp. 2T2.1]|nr:hypothetical protein GE09DRAFT_336740 [Coniochaeta sp. 2T2.1]